MSIPHVATFLRPDRRLVVLLRVDDTEMVLTAEEARRAADKVLCEARRVAEQLLCEAAYCDKWQAVIDRQEAGKP